MPLTCKFYGGNTGAIISNIWGLNRTLTPLEINSHTLSTYQPYWNDETYFLAKFQNNLEAGSVSTDVGTLQKILIYRKNQQEDALNFITEEDVNNVTDFYDYKVINNDVYEYYLFLQSESTITNPSKSNPVQSLYYGWYLVDIDKNKAYQLDIEFNGGNLVHNEDYTEHETNNKSNVFTRGNNHYIEGDVEAVLSKNNKKEDIINTNDELVLFREFIHSDRPKYLKSRRNKIYKVIVYDYREVLLNNHITENIYKVSFKFKEVGDV